MGLQWGLRWWEWWELKWGGARARRQGPRALVFVLCTHLFPGAQVLGLVEKIESGLSLDSAGGSPVGAGGEGSSAGAGVSASPRLASAGGRGGARGSVSFQLHEGAEVLALDDEGSPGAGEARPGCAPRPAPPCGCCLRRSAGLG